MFVTTFICIISEPPGGDMMKCNYKPPKFTKEEQQEMASLKSTLPYIDRLQIDKRTLCEVKNEELEEEKDC